MTTMMGGVTLQINKHPLCYFLTLLDFLQMIQIFFHMVNHINLLQYLLTMSIAPSGCLSNRIQPSQGTNHTFEANIYSRFN
ncbi:hypothetical protein D3C78_756240 [compost metagenome]